MEAIFPVLCAAFLAARKRVLDREVSTWLCSAEGDEAAAAGSPDVALPFAGSMAGGIEMQGFVQMLGRNVVNGNDKGSPVRAMRPEVPQCLLLWPPARWLLSGWQLSFELVEVSLEVVRLTLELDAQLQSGLRKSNDRESELGSRLAQSLAVEAAYSELLTSVGGRSHHDD